MTSTAPAQNTPMRHGGGLLLCCVGAAIVVGALLGNGAIAPLLGVGFCLGVLAIVAVHFLLMIWSFGRWIFYLGIEILVWLAIAWMQALPLPITLVGDGLLKIGFGATMAAPLFLRAKLG